MNLCSRDLLSRRLSSSCNQRSHVFCHEGSKEVFQWHVPCRKTCQALFWTQLFVLMICSDMCEIRKVWMMTDDGVIPGWLFSHGHDMPGVELGLIQLSRDIQQRRCGILHVFGIGTSAIADWTLPSASWSDRPDILQLHVWHTLKIIEVLCISDGPEIWGFGPCSWLSVATSQSKTVDGSLSFREKRRMGSPGNTHNDHQWSQCIGYRNISFEIKWLWHTTGWNSSLKNLQLLDAIGI